MPNRVCEKFGIDFPVFAFSHCRDVVAAVSREGGFGVFGAARYTPEQLEMELNWIDKHVDGRPYGLDLIVPTSVQRTGQTVDAEELVAKIPQLHIDFVNDLLARHDIPNLLSRDDLSRWAHVGLNLQDFGAEKLLDVAFAHPIRLIVNALGVPPPVMLEYAQRHGVATGALVGTADHARRQAEAGVDLLIAAGTEAGGHCGEVSTLVLVPEVVRTVRDYEGISVVAAGGIATGAQMAGAMAMGAEGVWCGSVWLTTIESDVNPVVKEKYLDANSSMTARSRCRTGKHSRQLRGPWTDAWEAVGAPSPLPMPMQLLLTIPLFEMVERLASGGHAGARDLVSYFVGQGIGLVNEPVSCRQVLKDFRTDFADAAENLLGILEDQASDRTSSAS